MKTLGQHTEVASYFDQIADGYSARYGERNPFHSYFFRQRIKAATDNFAFDGKSVLDIGAGTGALYDELICRFPAVDYFACDISEQMLAQSSIPKERAFVGSAPKITFPREEFDFIFSLGVTTYQTTAELAGDLRFIANRLAPQGIAIISFTNRGSIDHVLRAVMRIARPMIKRGVLGQSFPTHAYRINDVKEMVGAAGLHVFRTAFLNHTLSPFNTLLPRPSVALARAIERAPTGLLPPLSSDFVVYLERAD